MEMTQLTLRERQLEYLRILRELDRYCNVSGLRYFIGCGTLIGAVRHKGFIPWDDDLDVFMPRPDFLKFSQMYESDDFSLHTIRNDKSHPYLFGRLCSHKVYSLFRDKPRYDFGIDLYVINGAPSDPKEQQLHIKEVFKQKNRAIKLNRFRNRLVALNLWPFKTLDFPLLNKQLFRAEHVFEKYDFETSEYIWPFGGGKLILKKELYGEPVKLFFEDGYYNAPEHYHEVLTKGYGDYMVYPPEEKRKPRHIGSFYWDY